MNDTRVLRSRRIKLALAICVSGVVLLVLLFREPALVRLAHWLDVGEPPRAADFVMVLPGGPENRPFVAASMMRAGLVKGVLTAETATDPSNDEGLVPETDDLMKRVMILRGIREDQIQVLPGQSISTWTDAQALSRFLKDHPNVTVAIVTDGYHTRRSRWVFHRVLNENASRVFFVSAPSDTVFPESWWTTEEGLTTYLGEYTKFAIYVFADRRSLIIELGIGIAVILAWHFLRKNTRRQNEGSAEHGSTPRVS